MARKRERAGSQISAVVGGRENVEGKESESCECVAGRETGRMDIVGKGEQTQNSCFGGEIDCRKQDDFGGERNIWVFFMECVIYQFFFLQLQQQQQSREEQEETNKDEKEPTKEKNVSKAKEKICNFVS